MPPVSTDGPVLGPALGKSSNSAGGSFLYTLAVLLETITMPTQRKIRARNKAARNCNTALIRRRGGLRLRDMRYDLAAVPCDPAVQPLVVAAAFVVRISAPNAYFL